MLVGKVGRWGRSVADLVASLHERTALGVAFVSLTEARDLSMPSGRALATIRAVFAELERDMFRARARSGHDRVRREGKRLGRTPPAARYTEEIHVLARRPSRASIARRLGIGEPSVRRVLAGPQARCAASGS